MEFRYMGFDQQKNARAFRFDVVEKGEPVRRIVITADLALFLTERVAIQEGPSLCAAKLAADMEKGLDGSHELTEADLHAHTAARTLAEARRAEARRTPRRAPASTAPRENQPWGKRF